MIITEIHQFGHSTRKETTIVNAMPLKCYHFALVKKRSDPTARIPKPFLMQLYFTYQSISHLRLFQFHLF